MLCAYRPDTVAARRAMKDKDCEVTPFAPLLNTLPTIEGLIITADTLHCQRAHAVYLHERRTLCLPAMANQPRLSAAPPVRSPRHPALEETATAH